DRLGALARRLRAKQPPAQRPTALDNKPLPVLPGAGGGPPAETALPDLPGGNAEQRLRGLLDVSAKAWAGLRAAIPEGDGAWRERNVQKGYLARSQANVPQASGPRRSVAAMESDLARLRDQLQQAGLLGPVAGQPAAAPELGIVRDITPGGFVVVEVHGDVRPEQALRLVRFKDDHAIVGSRVTVVAVNGKEAVARVVSGQAQRGDRLLPASDPAPSGPDPNVPSNAAPRR